MKGEVVKGEVMKLQAHIDQRLGAKSGEVLDIFGIYIFGNAGGGAMRTKQEIFCGDLFCVFRVAREAGFVRDLKSLEFHFPGIVA